MAVVGFGEVVVGAEGRQRLRCLLQGGAITEEGLAHRGMVLVGQAGVIQERLGVIMRHRSARKIHGCHVIEFGSAVQIQARKLFLLDAQDFETVGASGEEFAINANLLLQLCLRGIVRGEGVQG